MKAYSVINWPTSIHRCLLSSSIILLFILLFLSYFHPITAIRQDLGRHLLLGKIIVETKTVPKTNLLSYTYPNAPFVNSHWLYEVVAYTVHELAGFDGLLLMTAVIGTLAFFLVFIYGFHQSGAASTILASVLFLPLLFERTDVRPEIFSFFFLAVFIITLYRYRESSTKFILLLPIIELLWVNTHIYFFLGIVITSLFFLERIVMERHAISQTTKKLGYILLSLIFVTVMNPNGIHGTLFPLTFQQNYGFPVIENQSIFFLEHFFHQPSIVFFKAAVMLSLAVLFITRKKARLIDWLLVICFGFAGAIAIRNIPLFVFAAFLPFSKAIPVIISSLSQLFTQYITKTHRIFLNFLFLFLFLLILCSILAKLFLYQPAGRGVELGESKAVDFFIKHNLHGPMYNSFDAGSYLAYRLYPQEKVFVDGRVEAYPKAFFEHIYLPMQRSTKRFEEISNKYTFNILFISHADQTPWPDPLLTYLLKQNTFLPIYLDDYAIIFARNTDENAELLKGYRIQQTRFALPKDADMNTLIRYLYFFHKIGWGKQEAETIKRIMSNYQSSCQLAYRLSLLSQEDLTQAWTHVRNLNNHCRSSTPFLDPQ